MEEYKVEENIDEINPDGIEYVDIKNIINVFQSTEYDSLEKAASEIIDNSIDANASKISIYINSNFDISKGKSTLSEIAFLDNGEGMTPGRIQRIVGFGRSVGRGKDKIGKFGIGLNQASLYACDCFKVYSWLSQDEVYMSEFDANLIRQKRIEKAAPPIKTKLPAYITNNELYKLFFKNNGTLIVWSKIKQKHMAKPATIGKRFQNELGRIFRNYIWNKQVQMYLYISDTLNYINAIDPMFLLENTVVLGDPNGSSVKSSEGEPIFEPFMHEMLDNGCKKYDIPYYADGGIIKTAPVYLKAAIIKEKFYYKAAQKDGIKQPGDTELGAATKDLQKGITVVRNNREIDFNYFGFYDSTNQPADRWFKLEIDFSEELDEIFDVSNNKQHVGIKKIPDSKRPDFKESEPDYPLWLRLSKDINKLIAAMRLRNKALASSSKRQVVESKEVLESKDLNVVSSDTSLEDVLNDFAGINTNDITLKKDEPIELNKNVELEKNIKDNIYNIEKNIEEVKQTNVEIDTRQLRLGELYEDAKIEIFYDQLDNEVKYESYYDFKVKKYIITFNSTLFKDLSHELEGVISFMCKELCKLSPSTKEYTILKKNIDNSLDIVMKLK